MVRCSSLLLRAQAALYETAQHARVLTQTSLNARSNSNTEESNRSIPLGEPSTSSVATAGTSVCCQRRSYRGWSLPQNLGFGVLTSQRPFSAEQQPWSTSLVLSNLRLYATHKASKPAPAVLASLSPDTTLLEHYRKNIHPRQLTFRISKRTKLKELMDITVLYGSRMDTIAAVAVLCQVRESWLRDPDFSNDVAQQVIDTCIKRIKADLKYSNLQSVAAGLWALAKLRSAFARPGKRGKAATVQEEQSPATSTAPQLRLEDDLLLMLLRKATNNRTTMLSAPPRQLCTLLWAVAELLPHRAQDPELQHALDKVAVCSVRRLDNFGPLELSVFADAYARLAPRFSLRFNALQADLRAVAAEDAFKASLERCFNERNISKPVPAAPDAAAWQKTTYRLIDALSEQVSTRFGNLAYAQPEPRNLALLASAFAKLGLPRTDVLAAISRCATTQAPDFSPSDWVLLVQSFAKLGVREKGLLEAAEAHLKQHGEKLYSTAQRHAMVQALQELGQPAA